MTKLPPKVKAVQFNGKAWTAVKCTGDEWQVVELEIEDGVVVKETAHMANHKAVVVEHISQDIGFLVTGGRGA